MATSSPKRGSWLLEETCEGYGKQRSLHSSVRLLDELWGDQPPQDPMNALHRQVSRLRRAIDVEIERPRTVGARHR